MQQEILPDKTVFTAGETVTFRLSGVPAPAAGTAMVRTNLGRAAIRRSEVVEATEKGIPEPGLDWRDLPMRPGRVPGEYQLTLPLYEVGFFEAKCCFIPADGAPILWPRSGNFAIKVGSAESASGNTVYCAFVRQFGAAAGLARSPEQPASVAELSGQGYAVLPPSGTFRSLIARLDHIFDDLGCRILQLLPIHPVPTQYGRMGLYGSPFAALDYFSVDPALADFDVRATPLEQFGELIDAVHARHGRIFMDIPVNHTGWASKLQMEHPDYFVRRADGEFESPGAWGVVWADLCKLDYRDVKVRELMAKVMLFWCRRGVDGFRCDAGYMVPVEAWRYITARVRREYPDTVFLLEGLGGPAAVQEQLLLGGGLDWGYSELFQNYHRSEITRYHAYLESAVRRCGTLVNFAETHDNNRLAATSETYARLRFLVNALLAEGAAFGFANGAEFFAVEKIDVHGAGGLNFGHEPNLVALIGQLNSLQADHPAFAPGAVVELIQRGPGDVIAARRRPPEALPGTPPVLVLLNLDCDRRSEVRWPREGFPSSGRDLLTGEPVQFRAVDDDWCVELAPGAGYCLDFEAMAAWPAAEPGREPEAVLRHRAAAMAQRAAAALLGVERAGEADAAAMRSAPEAWVASIVRHAPPPLTVWHGAFDGRRRVMVPPGDLLLVTDAADFICRILDGAVCVGTFRSLVDDTGRRFALVPMMSNRSARDRKLTLRLTRFPAGRSVERVTGELVVLAEAARRRIDLSRSCDFEAARAFAANGSGSYVLTSAAWGRLNSKYDALLAANLNSGYPVDRRILLTRCRAWLVVEDYSQELGPAVTCEFTGSVRNRARWRFRIPSGQGRCTGLELDLALDLNSDTLALRFYRPPAVGAGDTADSTAARLIIRPDLEDRINHQVTRAYTGPERSFPAAVRTVAGGFEFAPGGHRLVMTCDRGRFVSEPEWHYMVELPLESDYGLDHHTDLFSPGYFEIQLGGGESVELTAAAVAGTSAPTGFKVCPEELPSGFQARNAGPVLQEALRRFVVRRDELSTVIAGYPWFLDWGRDTLIVLRGLIQSEAFRPAAERIIRQFAAFERGGTIPNMIRGADDANRDTSDAPLYLIAAVRDYCRITGESGLLESDCGGRRLRTVLESVVENYCRGTANGIVMDPDSKLIFSPSHFTWMDTNFPAGTPREGYPIEIQALWYAALDFLGRRDLAENVAHSIERWFFPRPGSWCSDCLHAAPGVGAAAAAADDHLRPNQLLAVTLGAVRDPEKRLAIVDGCGELLTPGGIRTLADRDTVFELPVWRDGVLLNSPGHPYRGGYHGPEDTSRKVAYHNGTVWCWPFPAYCEALALVGGRSAKKRALDLLWSVAAYLEDGVSGQLPEVADGDAPHAAGGCPAQAWSISELYRVHSLLTQDR